jgi:Uma2 family endonuclease
MMTTAIKAKEVSQKPLTAEEYLKMQHAGGRETAPKYEFVNQKLIYMAGASINHNRINRNLTIVLGNQSWNSNKKQEVFANDMRVVSHVEVKNYFYPDIVLVEGRIYLDDDDYKETLMNPTVVIEVLSKRTEGMDRGDKFLSFRRTKSVKEYILVSQYEPKVDHYFTDEDGKWQFGEVYTEGTLTLKTTPFELKLEDIYRNVDFDDPIASKDPEDLEAEKQASKT